MKAKPTSWVALPQWLLQLKGRQTGRGGDVTASLHAVVTAAWDCTGKSLHP